MNNYSIALFLHIVGAVGFFMALGLEWTGLSQIRSAMSLEQVRAWMGILTNVRKVGFVSMLTTVITGIYMMMTTWGNAAWLYVTLGSLVIVIAMAQVLTTPRMMAIGRTLITEKGPLSKTFHSLASNSLLWVSLHSRVAVALGIVLLKITKPDLSGSLLTMCVTIVLGLVSTRFMPQRERTQEGSVG